MLAGNMDKTVSTVFTRLESTLGNLKQDLEASAKRAVAKANVSLEHTEKNVSNLSPENVMKRGYSITLHNGRAVTSISQLKLSDKITTRVLDGETESIITTLKKESHE